MHFLKGAGMMMEIALKLADGLASRKMRIVFAESCTGGLVSAELAAVPGISEWLCGSAVTYRCATKAVWLGVSSQDIEKHTAVSQVVAGQMAEGVLSKTPEASLALSITGHLGPDAPEGFDGLVYIGVATKLKGGDCEVQVSCHQLEQQTRRLRQSEAASLVMRSACTIIDRM